MYTVKGSHSLTYPFCWNERMNVYLDISIGMQTQNKNQGTRRYRKGTSYFSDFFCLSVLVCLIMDDD